MTSLVFAFYLTWLVSGQMAQKTVVELTSAHQESDFVSITAGSNLTLRCLYKGEIAPRLYWYKQTLGQKPQLISTYYTYDKTGTFFGNFISNPRFTLDTEKGKNYLTITDLQTSDSATYYCMHCYLYNLEFSESIIVNIKASGVNIPPSVHQSSSEIIQPGGSVTLNCTVHTGTCHGEHSVYWFRTSQEESHPGLIYTHGGRNDQCERKDDTQTHTCIYNLPMESLNLSHAGTYYCAVASCGHILFGDGTKLNMVLSEGESASVYFWRGLSALTTVLAVVLAFTVCAMNKRNSRHTSESGAHATANAEDDRSADNLYYAALSVSLTKRAGKQRDQTWSECVYYRVK